MNKVKNDYESSVARLHRFRLKYCPIWVIQGFGVRKICPMFKTRKCPVVREGGFCDGCRKTGGMGIDHPGVYVREDGNREYVFRPYFMSEKEKSILESLCKEFGFEVEYTNNSSYEGTKDVIVRMKLPENCRYYR